MDSDRFLSRYWDGRVPVDVVGFASDLGLDVYYVNGAPDAYCGEYDASKRAIFINAAHHPNRQRFTVAHEIAHHVLNHGSQFRDYEQDMTSDFWQEREANSFGAEILMPREAIIYLKNQGIYLPSQLAEHFMVSVTAMTYRLRNLSFI